MIGNWIKCTTTTTGTGALTVASVASFPTLSDAFKLGQPISYNLLDATGAPIEAGVGYLSATNTFVRSSVKATYAGGVYTNVAPTAQTLAGTTTVICAPIASSMFSALPAVDKVSASVGRMVTTAHRGIPNGTQTLTADRLYHVPFLYKGGSAVNALAISIATAGAAGTKARAAIYACGDNGYPGVLLVSTGDLDTSATGLKVGSFASTFLPPGWYFASMASSGVPAVVPYISSPAMLGGGPLGFLTGTSTAIDYRYEALTSGWTVLPANASTTTTAVNVATGNTPAVYWQLD